MKCLKYNSVNYIDTFPKKWLLNNIKGTGPNECEKCREVGRINDVFIGYCVKCAVLKYKNDRGTGFIKKGLLRKELWNEKKNINNYYLNKYEKELEIIAGREKYKIIKDKPIKIENKSDIGYYNSNAMYDYMNYWECEICDKMNTESIKECMWCGN